MTVFRIYNENGGVSFDNQKTVLGLIKSGHLKRFIEFDTDDKKRDYISRTTKDPRITKDYLILQRRYYEENPTASKDFLDVISGEYTIGRKKGFLGQPLRGLLSSYSDNNYYDRSISYYIDVECQTAPIAFLHCDIDKPKYSGVSYKHDYASSPFLGLHHMFTHRINQTTYRVVFCSAMFLSDRELARFRVYLFGTFKQKQNKVGLNLYDEQGNLTFSSSNLPLKMFIAPLNMQTKTAQTRSENVFIDADGWQGNWVKDYTFKALNSNHRYAVMCHGITELVVTGLDNGKYGTINLSQNNRFYAVLYRVLPLNNSTWDFYSHLHFGGVGGRGFIGAYLSSTYYRFAKYDYRSSADRLDFTSPRDKVNLYVADVSHLPFPYN